MKSHPLGIVVVVLIRIYQMFSLALHRTFGIPEGRGCRFSPTCSEYTSLAIQKHGVFKGTTMGIKRLSKCHPWGPPTAENEV